MRKNTRKVYPRARPLDHAESSVLSVVAQIARRSQRREGLWRRIAFGAVISAVIGVPALTSRADAVVLTATDSKTIATTGENWNDNRVRAYWNIRSLDGFMKFDLSSIPDSSEIVSMTLTTYHEYGFYNPRHDPQVRIYRSEDDSWSRGLMDPHPGLNEVLTPLATDFPAANAVPVSWTLDVDAVDWSADLLDDTLSLAMRNEKLAYSYVYFHGSDSAFSAPTLTAEFTTEFTQGESVAAVPEPMTMMSLLALAPLVALRRRRH